MRLSLFKEAGGAEPIPLQEPSRPLVYEGQNHTPLGMKFLFSMMEASLYIQTRDGKEREIFFY